MELDKASCLDVFIRSVEDFKEEMLKCHNISAAVIRHELAAIKLVNFVKGKLDFN
jgi:hypothetical protein